MGDLELKKNIIVDLYDLKLPTMCIHRLMSAGITTLNDLIDADITSVKGLGIINIQEIQGVISQADEIFSNFARRQAKIDKIYKELSQVSLKDLPLGGRAIKALRMVNINTAGDLVHMPKHEVMGLHDIGIKTQNEILNTIDGLRANGIEYLKGLKPSNENISGDSGDGHNHNTTEPLKLDYSLIDRLKQEFFLRTETLAEWLGCSKHNIQDLLIRRPKKRYTKWTGKRMTQEEAEILRELVASRKSKYCGENIACYLLNNRRDNFVCLFFYPGNVKCFFLEDLPSSLQTTVIESNLQKITAEEFGIASSGTVVGILKQKHFIPAPTDKKRFLHLASLRGIYANEYSLFLTGLPLASSNQVTDERILQFLESHQVNGEVRISSETSNSWIRTFANRNGFSLNGLIVFYGYRPARNSFISDYLSRSDESVLTNRGNEKHTPESVDLKLLGKASWTAEEDSILREYYPVEGNNVVHRLPGKSIGRCSRRAEKLGISSQVHARWTQEEDGILREYYPTEGKRVADRLNRRTATACMQRARKLGVSRLNRTNNETTFSHRLWTNEEEDIVRRYYPTLGKAIAEMLPGRTDVAISQKYYKLVEEDANRERTDSESSILKLPGIATWTKEEDDILRKYYPTEGSQVVTRLPRHTAQACTVRAARLGISYRNQIRWSEEEDAIVLQDYPVKGAAIAELLPGRSASTILKRFNKLTRTERMKAKDTSDADNAEPSGKAD